MNTLLASNLEKSNALSAARPNTRSLHSFLMVCDVIPRQFGGGMRFWVELGRKSRANGIRMGLLLSGEPIPSVAEAFHKQEIAWWSLPDWKRDEVRERRWRFIDGFRRVNARENWDVVSFHHCSPLSVIGACTWSRIRDGRRFARVWHQHQGIPSPRGIKKYFSSLRLLGPFMDAYVANSELAVRSFQERHCPATKVRVIQNGVQIPPNMPRGSLRARLNLSESTPLLVTAASLIPRKGLDVLLEAISPLFKMECREWNLVIVGDGPLRRELEDLTRHLGIDSQVHFIGRSNNVPEILGDCNVFVLPSRNEAMPVAILEAMAASLPVVATDVGCVADVVVHGKTGLLVPPEDVSALRSALQAVLSNNLLASEFGVRGRERATEAFSVEQQVDGYLSLYQDVCAHLNS